jgi:hypothetical protein
VFDRRNSVEEILRFISFSPPIKTVKGNLSLCLTNKALLYQDVWGNEGVDQRILDLGISWR